MAGKKREVSIHSYRYYKHSKIIYPKDWLHDKLSSSPFAFPAIYRPNSHIPLDVWRAGPESTNGNEQAHRNIYRDGTGLTMLAAIMRGLQYDRRIQQSMEVYSRFGVYYHDTLPTTSSRIQMSVDRQRMFFLCHIIFIRLIWFDLLCLLQLSIKRRKLKEYGNAPKKSNKMRKR